MAIVPRSEQLPIPPEYGRPSRLLEWDAVEKRLEQARYYWLATVRPDGRPHVVPLDGLWVDARWYFGGSPSTVKHRNLLANPHATVHLDGGGAAVIVDGSCRIETPSRQLAEGLVAASTAKYGYAPPIEAYLGGVWALSPERVLAWTDLTVDATRYLFV
ncbi:MAG TPA: pyridoxamine 5'-phosphate oxidase family protein [Acidimicrobiales bacterium]|nr:pyridoxamine 5'-phosphate oxidase family protein [Acidimicrobiales bacterium]